MFAYQPEGSAQAPRGACSARRCACSAGGWALNGWLVASTSFLASAVEAVEALTIVLAVGLTRSWRVALSGAAWGLATLIAIVLVAGPAIVAYVPFAALRTAIGAFLLVFGLAWLRKAILRYSGRKALHDETAIYAREVSALKAQLPPAAASEVPPNRPSLSVGAQPHGLVGPSATARDPERLAFFTAYNAVLLEGLEVAVIVLTIGASSAAALAWAGCGALIAILVVSAAGVVLRAPLSRVPENALKFTVGIMLTSVGTFWCGEGLGIGWWHDDLSLPFIAVIYAISAAATIIAARRPQRPLRSAA